MKPIIEEHDLYVVEYLSESFDFAICSPRTAFKSDTIHRRKPGTFHHMAFRVNSRKEVDELYLRIKVWLYCPICNSKTRIQLRTDTVLENFPLFCPKCKHETVIISD